MAAEKVASIGTLGVLVNRIKQIWLDSMCLTFTSDELRTGVDAVVRSVLLYTPREGVPPYQDLFLLNYHEGPDEKPRCFSLVQWRVEPDDTFGLIRRMEDIPVNGAQVGTDSSFARGLQDVDCYEILSTMESVRSAGSSNYVVVREKLPLN